MPGVPRCPLERKDTDEEYYPTEQQSQVWKVKVALPRVRGHRAKFSGPTDLDSHPVLGLAQT